MHDRTRFLLKQVGLGAEEIQALDCEPLQPLPDKSHGFGLVGPAGTGKTWLLTQHLGRQVQQLVEAHPHPDEALMPHWFARWRNWPATAETLKRWVAQSYTDDVDELVEELTGCRQLYLDDLGQERIVKADDYALGILREILDGRYRAKLPVFWTSNLTPPHLNLLYGARTASRMFSSWPPVPISGPNLRLVRRPA